MQNSVYEWVDFSKFPKISAKIGSNLIKCMKNRWFCSIFGTKLVRLVYEWVTFSWKIGICMGLLSNSAAAHPYQKVTYVCSRICKTNLSSPYSYLLETLWILIVVVPCFTEDIDDVIKHFMTRCFRYMFYKFNEVCEQVARSFLCVSAKYKLEQ